MAPLWPIDPAASKYSQTRSPCAGRGLWLQVDAEGTAGWQLTLTFEGVQQDVELGTFPDLSVRQARKAAAAWRSIARSGLDPAQQQEAIRNAAARNLDQFYC